MRRIMLWIYLHFPHLLLDQIRRCRPPEAPLVITDGQRQTVLQACPAALQQGIHPGMRLKTALTLCAELEILCSDRHREQQLLEDQARWLYRHASPVSLCPPDGLLAEIGSLERLYGGLPAVWQTLEQTLEDRQLTAWLATGHTPLAARLLARSGQGECTPDKGRMEQALARLPLPLAEFDTATLKRLERLGLSRLGEVFSLPAAELARRLTPEVLAHTQKIRGTRADPRQSWQPPHTFRQQVDFLQEIEQTQGLLFPLQRLLNELEEDLCWHQKDTDCLLLVLKHRHHESTRIRIRTSGPEHRASTFLNLIRLQLEQHTLKAPVAALILAVRRFLEYQPAGGSDLLGETQDLNEAWHTLISRLQARLGMQALQQLAPQGDHRPERAWTARPVTLTNKPRPEQDQALPARPFWLLQGPVPLDQVPETWLSGPERISGGWWDGQRVQRDYYIARLSGGQLAWLFRDLNGGWFVHGLFG